MIKMILATSLDFRTCRIYEQQMLWRNSLMYMLFLEGLDEDVHLHTGTPETHAHKVGAKVNEALSVIPGDRTYCLTPD